MAELHPQIVHFTVALLALGVALRLVSLSGRPAFAGPAATTLLLLGTLASVLAVWSGDAGHGPVERVPGSRAAVVEHEEWGERTRNVFLVVAGLELLALALRRWRRVKAIVAASAVCGLIGTVCLYEAAEHGGSLVYSFAGGVGIRSGDPQDVARLLLAGLYHQAQQDRREGRAAAAAGLIDEALRRFPDDLEVRLLAVESLLVDRHDPAAALAAVDGIAVPQDGRFLRMRHGSLRAEALEAAGRREEAVALLEALSREFPASTRLAERLSRLKGGGVPPP
jgi:uncharacterized membrane protein